MFIKVITWLSSSSGQLALLVIPAMLILEYRDNNNDNTENILKNKTYNLIWISITWFYVRIMLELCEGGALEENKDHLDVP